MFTYDKEKIKETFKKDIFPVLTERIRNAINKINNNGYVEIEEIRLRTNKPLMVYKNNEGYFVDEFGNLRKDNGLIVYQEEISKIYLLMCDYSLYSMEEDIKQGFLTIKGGHRVGIVGKVVSEAGKIKTIKNISSLNIRIAKEVKGCALELVKNIYFDGVKHTLIVSPPGCGKTTILRDIVRLLSNGVDQINLKGKKVAVVDERSEIACCYMGIPQKDVGIRTDVLDSCPKADGLMMLVRSMSPDVIAVDEIGGIKDADAIMDAINTGVKIISTAHGRDFDEILKRSGIRKLLENNCIDIIVFLSNRHGPGTVENIMRIN
ncbi:stage III sporulation protein AA [Thermobrachium celere]|uniref:Stage III sporulation protein AA n=1 Tax=Thermobrachium celere DSM 8682 TaxID=941824 RepID=R7RSF6_9CLOT|nr:stage III sporulation protein AA [Thermobrachium celere]CDF58218.1 Stage III sporulation protein AA [Thermobrachium celere DSM 8682]